MGPGLEVSGQYRYCGSGGISAGTQQWWWVGIPPLRPFIDDVVGIAERVYLVAMFYNNQDVLPFWTEQMTRFIYYVGTVESRISRLVDTR